MNLQEWKRWEKLRKNGKWFFAFVLGGLVFGPIFGATISLLFHVIIPTFAWESLVLVVVPASIFSGVLWNLWRWDRQELRFLSENPPRPRRKRYS